MQETRGWSRERGAEEEVRPETRTLAPVWEREMKEGTKSGSLWVGILERGMRRRYIRGRKVRIQKEE